MIKEEPKVFMQSNGEQIHGYTLMQNTSLSKDIAGDYLAAMMSTHSIVSGYYLDLNTRHSIAICQEKIYQERYNSEDDWSRMDDYIRECIHPDDQAAITAASRIEFIRECVKTNQEYSIKIRDLSIGQERWLRYIVMRCSDANHAAILFRDITQSENRRLELARTKDELTKSLGISSAMTTSFKNIYLIDKKSRTIEVVKLDGYVTHGLDKSSGGSYPYDTLVATYIQNRVFADDKAFVTKALSWDVMLEGVMNNDSYQFTYRVLEDGELHFYQGRFRNIDEQYATCGFQNIDDTIAQEKEYNDIIAAAGFGVWHIYLKDGKIPRMQANEKMAELLGIDASNMTEEDVYDAWYTRITPDAIPSVQKSVGEMLEGKFSENTYLWTHPTKGDIYVRCGGTAIKQADGSFVVRGYHADVTDIVFEEQKHNNELEQARQKAEQEREKLADAYGMIYGLSQEYHTIWLVSKETSEMRLIRTTGVSTIQNAVQMGYDYPKFDVGFEKYINTYVEPEDRERMRREIAFDEILRQLEKGDFYAVNYLRRDDTGHVGYHQIAFSNADTEDGRKMFVYGFRDIDDLVREEQKQKDELRKAKEAADAANRAKTSFLFNMSHDIRTPMNAIMGFRDMLEKHQDDPVRRKDYLQKIEESSKILLSIINNVLEMARIEKGTLKVDDMAWSAEQFNDTLYSVFRDMMEQKGISFTRQIVVQNNYVFCDPIKLREIFINIISNAYKYTNSGGSVNMHLEEIPSNREGWALYQTTISDTGIGMSKEFLPHIYDEFARENNTTDAKVEGTGLGMPIVKRLVEILNGTIEVTSEKGKGTTFVVTIPHRIANKEELIDHASVDVDPMLFKDKRILLTEDNDLNAEIATDALEEAGLKIERAEDGAICCKMLEDAAEGYYDLILMDIQMPNMNGYEATRKIRKMKNPAKAYIPIIAMTANAFEEDKREALAAGMNSHLPKPVKARTLIREIANILVPKTI